MQNRLMKYDVVVTRSISKHIVDNSLTAAGQLNIDLVKIPRWVTTWLVSFNPTKTEAMLFSRKLNRPHHPPIFMQNHQITEVD